MSHNNNTRPLTLAPRNSRDSMDASYRVAIALLGKGSTNHLHREEMVAAFRKRGVQVQFIVRKDYEPLLEKMDGCEYSYFSIQIPNDWRFRVTRACSHVRTLYPSRDVGKKAVFRAYLANTKGLSGKVLEWLYRLLASSRLSVRLVARLEKMLFRPEVVKGINPKTMDQLILLGIGTTTSELEGSMTWWTGHHGVPVVHVVGNYDNLTSQGFRAVDVERLLVWGPNMRDDAVNFHGIPASRVTKIGSVRYDSIPRIVSDDRSEFLNSLGLDPGCKTILFGGFVMPFHYFEMLEVYRELLGGNEKCQLILRVYPNKVLLNSVYVEPMLAYCKQIPGVYVSIGDPHYRSGARDREVLNIEESELWNSLKHCDVVLNIYSTLSLEGCIFDKPVVNMWYFPEASRTEVRPREYFNYASLLHNRRITSYGAIRTAKNRDELISMIRHAWSHPDELAEQRRETVKYECGVLDGDACERFVEACVEEMKRSEN